MTKSEKFLSGIRQSPNPDQNSAEFLSLKKQVSRVAEAVKIQSSLYIQGWDTWVPQVFQGMNSSHSSNVVGGALTLYDKSKEIRQLSPKTQTKCPCQHPNPAGVLRGVKKMHVPNDRGTTDPAIM